MAPRQDGASNVGLARLREQRIRRTSPYDGTQIAYENAGVTKNVRGDEDAPWIKVPPFPSLQQGWETVRFSNEADPPDGAVDINTYTFFPPLDIDPVRNLTLWVSFEGRDTEDSQLSLIPGALIPGGDLTPEFFFPLSVVGTPISPVVLSSPFGSQAESRQIMPAEFRTAIVVGATPEARTLQFTFPLDVVPYLVFTVAAADLVGGQPTESFSLLRMRYSYAE